MMICIIFKIVINVSDFQKIALVIGTRNMSGIIDSVNIGVINCGGMFNEGVVVAVFKKSSYAAVGIVEFANNMTVVVNPVIPGMY